MEDARLTIEEFLQKSQAIPVMDVRSPDEFNHGHFPGAVNLPLFTNEERSVVGTLYLQKGSDEAMMKGLEMIGPKMKDFASQAFRLAPDRMALVYCWRGGMRSSSMAWLMNTVGIRTSILEGGYKAFRRFVQAAFEKPLHLVVLGGMTGSGKTRVLEALEDMGQQVIHLERLASHKGSVFGGIGMPSQPTTEQFENNLFHCIGRIDTNQPVFVEDESITIGRIFIPRPFYNRMSTAPLITIHVPSEQRIEQLVGMYATGNETQLVEGINRLVKRLGQENASETVGLVESGNLSEAVGRLLPYYDKLYKRSMEKHKRLETIHLEGGFDDPTVIASRILSLIHIP